VSGSAVGERVGPVQGAAAGFGDSLKPVLVVLVAQRLAGYEVAAMAGVATVVGHIWPITLRFRGGRGVAPAGAALAALGAWQMVLALAGLTLGKVLLKDSAPGALVGFVATAVTISLTSASLAVAVTAWVLLGVLVLGRLLGYRKLGAPRDASFTTVAFRRLLLDRDQR
jgi:glycerol-3-phosphate acyltransferase PlsY